MTTKSTAFRQQWPHFHTGKGAPVSKVLPSRPLTLAVAVAAACSSGVVHGVAMTQSDVGAESTFTTGLHFPAGNQPPLGTVDYETGAFRMRTERLGGDQDFSGQSLTVEGAGGSLAITNAAGAEVTVDDLQIQDGGVVEAFFFDTVSLDGVITVSGTATFDARRGDVGFSRNLEIVGDIGGTGGVSVVSPGTDGGVVTFAGTNTFDGDTSVGDGAVLRMGAANAMPQDASDGDLIVDSGGVFETNGNATIIQGLSGAGTVQNANAAAATLTIQGDSGATNNSFTGTIQDGTGGGALSIAKTESTSQTVADLDITGSVAVTGGTLSVDTITNAGDVSVTTGGDLDAGATTATTATLSGGTADLASLTTSGAGTNLTVTGGTNTVTAAVDTSGGDASITGGSLTAGSLSSGAVDVGSAGTLNTTGASTTGAITSSGNVDASGAITASGQVAINDGTATFAGGLDTSSNAFTQTGGTSTVTGLTTGTADANLSGGTANVDGFTGTDLNVSGGTTNLSGTGSFAVANVTGGTLNVQSDNALDGSGDTNVSGTGQVSIDGSGLDVDEVFNLFSTSGGVQLVNVANANTISGAIALTDTDNAGPDDTYTISSASGTLSLTGGIASSLTSGGRILNLTGDGDGDVSALTFDSATGNTLNKTGAGTWTVADAAIDAGTIASQAGVLALTGPTDLSGDMVYDVMMDAGIDVTGVTGPTAGALNVTSGQTLQGGGLVTGDVVAASSSTISVGDDATAGQDLGISANLLDFAGSLALNVGGSSIDSLIVGGDFSLVDATLDITGSLSAAMYSIVDYVGTFVGGTFSTIVSGYSFDYGSGTADSIKLVRDTPIPAPTPAPLALVGLGLFMLARHARRSRR